MDRKRRKNVTSSKLYNIVLIFIVITLGYLSYRIIVPFLSALAWAIVLSIVFYPVYVLLLRLVKWRYLASFITLCIIIILIFGPFSYLSYLLTQELNTLIVHIKAGELNIINQISQSSAAKKIIYSILSLFNMTEGDFQKAIANSISQVGAQSFGMVKSGLGNAATALTDFLFMLLSIFFILEDGPKFLNKFSNYIPFSKEKREAMVKQIKDIVTSTIYGGIAIAVVQGAAGGFTLALLGVHAPVLWGMAMFVASFIPLLGTVVIWGPIAIYLFFQGFFLKGLILSIIGVFVISMADNILRPIFIRGKVHMPTLLIFFSILGGIKLFGFIGFIMGPLVFALFLSTIEIFRYSEE